MQPTFIVKIHSNFTLQERNTYVIYIYIYIYIHKHIHICICIDVYIYIYIHIYVYVYVHVYVYIYIYIYIYIAPGGHQRVRDLEAVDLGEDGLWDCSCEDFLPGWLKLYANTFVE